jgi:hypothetical protein
LLRLSLPYLFVTAKAFTVFALTSRATSSICLPVNTCLFEGVSYICANTFVSQQDVELDLDPDFHRPYINTASAQASNYTSISQPTTEQTTTCGSSISQSKSQPESLIHMSYRSSPIIPGHDLTSEFSYNRDPSCFDSESLLFTHLIAKPRSSHGPENTTRTTEAFSKFKISIPATLPDLNSVNMSDQDESTWNGELYTRLKLHSLDSSPSSFPSSLSTPASRTDTPTLVPLFQMY